MKELYQGQRAGDRLARKQNKEMKKEIERMKEESAQYRELYQGQKAGDELARKQVKEMKKEIERMEKENDQIKAESAQTRKENDQIKEEAAQNRKRYEEEKKNSALKLHDVGMDIEKIAGILNAEPAQVNEWVVRENEQKYNA